jgi:DnaJ-class molecular chaperone
MARGAECLNWACSDLWGAEVGNRPGLPDERDGPADETDEQYILPNRVTCPPCAGTGRIVGRACFLCAGSGTLSVDVAADRDDSEGMEAGPTDDG